MDTYPQTDVETVTYQIGEPKTGISRKYLLRQIVISSGLWVSYFTFGLCFGSPTVFIPQIRREANSTDAVSLEMVSWLSSAFFYSGFVHTIILAILARLIGRKLPLLYVCGSSLIGYIIFYYSTNVTQIIISEIIHGALAASPLTVSLMVLTEYVSPRYRGVFLCLKSASFYWGVWVANAIGTFLHWKTIGIVAFVCCLYSTLTCVFLPESPYWLASKNRLDDCIASHRWLKGCSKESEAELEMLIQSRKIVQSAKCKPFSFINKTVRMLRSRTFYKPLSLSLSVMFLYLFSGKVPFAIYVVDIIKKITGTESTAYTGMLILDGITILGMYVGCGLAKILKRRTLLLVTSVLGVIFLYSISFYLYLIHFNIILEQTVVSIALLMGYSLTVSIGPIIITTTILGELIPVKYRSASFVFVGCTANFFLASVVKVSPYVLNYVGARGLFLTFAICASLFTFITYKVLPETKDKSILEIQECLLGCEPNKNTNELIPIG